MNEHREPPSELRFEPDSLESTAIAEARFNSIKLFDDAHLMFDTRRWGTSIALSILSCEEAGKFVLFSTSLGKDFHSIYALRQHHSKQVIFANRLNSCLRLKALDEYFLGLGVGDANERAFKSLAYLDRVTQKLLAAGDISESDVERLVESEADLKPIWNYVKEHSQSDETFEIAVKAANGELDEIKQRGFYVDIADRTVHAPRQFTEKDACSYLRAAEVVTQSITIAGSSLDQPTPMVHIRVPLQL